VGVIYYGYNHIYDCVLILCWYLNLFSFARNCYQGLAWLESLRFFFFSVFFTHALCFGNYDSYHLTTE